MNITPEEFIDIQHQAAKKAIQSVIEIKPPPGIECGIEATSWLDPIDLTALGIVRMKIGERVSALNIKCRQEKIAEDAKAEVQRVYDEIRAHVEKEVEAVFGSFLDQIARRICDVRRKGVSKL